MSPSFAEKHGYAFHITQYMIRWFSGEGIANPDWAYTEKEDIALLFPEVIPAGGEVMTGIGMDFDFAERRSPASGSSWPARTMPGTSMSSGHTRISTAKRTVPKDEAASLYVTGEGQ